MRTIKFRGKSKSTQQWVYGYVREIWASKQEDCRYIICPSMSFEKDGWTDSEETEVIPETIGQFTGLFDKNDVEIYEGDICFNSNKTLITCEDDKKLYLVKWIEGKYIETNGHVWLGQHPEFAFEKIQHGKRYMSLIFNQRQIEIVGNITENADLVSF